MTELLYLNVGGVYFATTKATLLKPTSGSFFPNLVSSNPDVEEFFLDRDPSHFRFVLNWMRGVTILPHDEQAIEELLWEADYYRLPCMKEAITRAKRSPPLAKVGEGIVSELKAVRSAVAAMQSHGGGKRR